MSNRVKMRLLPQDERNKNFEEVACGYTETEALAEANRCLNCVNMPCVSGCPVNIMIPHFITKIKARDFEGAYEIIKESNNFPAICGRVCPQESQCEAKCIRGIKQEPVAIGRLERFVADHHQRTNEIKEFKKNGIKVAVIGSGPSGLSCAGELAKAGFEVDIYEALHKPGGVLVYGIPEFRLPKKIVEDEIEDLKQLGVRIMTNMVVGRVSTINELRDQGYKAIYIATGAGLPKFMNIPNENLNGVYTANEYLTRVNLMKAYEDDASTPIYHGKEVVVVGGGNVAMDAARCALRMKANSVTVVYRRSSNELPARAEEVEHAKEEGIKFAFLSNPIAIIGNNDHQVKGIKCIKMKLSSPDESGRQRPVEILDSEFVINCDMVIMAIGTTPNPLMKMTITELEFNKWGGMIIDENGMTNMLGVYAGGDAVTGAATVIKAMQAGKIAANSIIASFT
ncbi:MAG: NADPH-dependent glutamate synthase [Erysipelotrichaceae bacterium]|nr:NADPH-dependent glutamate synthase [Erysipelotrichaceae bacterium]MDD3924978.1 NADPH-dependent glutamate synthase [Erysipelotrichaceae bacterium]MDD4642298.1 NADPH-dependent glutamate synthase [Erysipelotrichaceae bacterium]